MITGATPILVAEDIPATLKFYTEVLGFTNSWEWGDPPTFGGANWGSVSIMFGQMLDLVGKVEGHQLWLNADDIDALHGLHLERGAMIVSPIEDKPWGRREYTLRDINGYHLRIGGDPEHTSKGTGAFPEGVKIERRLPTIDEYNHVAGAAFNNRKDTTGTLARTWQGIVATSPTGEVIGTTRIMYDGPGWFSIWDVAVLPEWQGSRIGSKMMEEALEVVREESPGAWVHLFTYKHKFYKRLGFSKESVSMRKV